MKVVINACHGGFGLSQAAYEKLIEWGVEVRKYVSPQRDPKTLLYSRPPENEGEVIFDRELTPPGLDEYNDRYWAAKAEGRTTGSYPSSSRYHEHWIRDQRTHPLLVRAVEELGAAANGDYSELQIVEIPDDVQWQIEEYDGAEWVAEKHRTWS